MSTLDLDYSHVWLVQILASNFTFTSLNLQPNSLYQLDLADLTSSHLIAFTKPAYFFSGRELCGKKLLDLYYCTGHPVLMPVSYAVAILDKHSAEDVTSVRSVFAEKTKEKERTRKKKYSKYVLPGMGLDYEFH